MMGSLAQRLSSSPKVHREPARIISRLRRHLSEQRVKHRGEFSAPQEDAWTLLNEVEQMVKVLQKVAKTLPPEDNSELAYQIRHTVVSHLPSWKAQAPEPFNEAGPPSICIP